MKNIFFIFALVMISLPAFAQTPQSKSETQTQTADLPPPAAWWKTGAHPEDHDFYPDSTVKRSGKASATPRSRPTAIKERFAVMNQARIAGHNKGGDK